MQMIKNKKGFRILKPLLLFAPPAVGEYMLLLASLFCKNIFKKLIY